MGLVTMDIDARAVALKQWVITQLSDPLIQLLPLTGDASFRCYFRAHTAKRNYVVMDAPPAKESTEPFIAIANALRHVGLCTPEIIAADITQGFLLLSDFGDQLYLDHLNATTASQLYQNALDALLRMQQCQHVEHYDMPPYDAKRLMDEMDLFSQWYIQKHLGAQLSAQEQKTLQQACDLLCDSALAQPVVLVHRDYHSRNLMVLPNNQVGILDFQDAVWGPITYDLVSLLRDCYIDWPALQIAQWLEQFRQSLLQAGLLTHDDPKEFQRWFDWMGLQRHLKCFGIFSRLCVRDNKPGYLQYLPRLQRYATDICAQYSELNALGTLLQRVKQ